MRKIKVQLSEYNPHWEQQYAVAQKGIEKALGDSGGYIEYYHTKLIKAKYKMSPVQYRTHFVQV